MPGRNARHLPSQPNLEQLRKQAKELLDGYRSQKSEAVAEVQQYELRPDPATFALNDAHRVLARAYGFQSWPKLKAFVDGANIGALIEAVQAGNAARVRTLLHARPELIGMDVSENDERRALHVAVLKGDAAMVKLLMEAGADARKGVWPHRDATSALALARDREHFEIVRIIEEEEQRRREDLSCPNATVSPMQERINEAIAAGDGEAARRLLAQDGSLIQACDRKGRTPLHIAAQENDPDMVRWLVERRAKVNHPDIHGLTPLDLAAMSVDARQENAPQFVEVATYLLEHGAELTLRGAVGLGDQSRVAALLREKPELLRAADWQGGGLLTLAVKHGQTEMVTLLLDLGADVDERVYLKQVEEPTVSWGGPLWNAALANHYPISELLLNRGADPNANVYASGWPLGNAWNHRDDSVKRLLLERGATPQPYMVSANHDVEGARKLLDGDPSEDVVSELAWSAADHGCPEILRLALPRLNWAADSSRWHWVIIQPIRGAGSDQAANEGYFDCLRLILEHGVDPNVQAKGATALHFTAARHSGLSGEARARFAAMLIDFGARLDLRDDLLQSTPLGWACRWGRNEMVKLLLSRGALAEEPDAEPWAAPIAWARKMGYAEISALLQDSIM